jgi:hypothetical protein
MVHPRNNIFGLGVIYSVQLDFVKKNRAFLAKLTVSLRLRENLLWMSFADRRLAARVR